MAVFHCSSCDITKQVAEEHVGKEIRCPKCGAAVMIADEEGRSPSLQADPRIHSVDLSDLAEQQPPDEESVPPPANDEEAKARGLRISERARKGDIRGRILQGGLAGNLTAGLLLGLLTFFISLAFALLVFPVASGQEYAFAVTMALTAGAVTGVIAALGSGFPVAVAGPESAAGAILFLIVGRLSAQMVGAVPQEALLPTIIVLVSVSAAATGIGLIAVGLARTGALIRFIPYQVIGGVMAGVGFLLLKGVYVYSLAGGPGIMSGMDLTNREFVYRLAPAFALGLILFVVRRWFKRPWLLLGLLLAAVGFGNAAIQYEFLPGLSARAFNMPALEPFRFWNIYSPDFLTLVRWDLILEMLPYILALIAVVAASLMLKVTGLELEAGTESTMDRELKVVGLGCLLSGLAGGMPGSLSQGRTLGARGFGAKGPVAGILSGIVCAVGLIFAGRVLPFIPWFVPAGILVFMGLGLLHRWLVKTRSEFMLGGDYLLLLLIFLLIVLLGMLTGVAVGLALAMMVLLGRFGGVDVVRNVLFGDHLRSNVDRAPYQLKILREKGGQIMIMRLQGFLFLGTTNNVVKRIRKRAEDRERVPLKYIILDFTRISGLDSSVRMSFDKLRNVIAEYGATLIFTNVPFEMQQMLEAGGCVLNAPEQGSLSFVSVDYAMEWCENRILEAQAASGDKDESLSELLKPLFPETKYIPMLMKVLKKVEVKEDALIFRQGDPSDAMYFIEKGMVSIRLELEGGKLLRLKKMRPGTVFGEMGIYTSAPRTASAVAAEDCRLYRLSKSTLEKLKTVNPQFTSAIHRFIVNLLSTRVAEANAALRDLLK